MKSRNNLDLESNQRKLNETHNRMSLLPELNVQIPSRNKNQDTLKDTPTIIIKRRAKDSPNETKAVEETKRIERNITDKRAQRKRNKVKR